MTFRRVELPPSVAGRLWLSAMPGRLEPWPQFLAEASQVALTQVVCLTPRQEMAELSPAYDAAVVHGQLPFRWTLMPIRNFGVPEDRAGFRNLVRDLVERLEGGESVLLHCAAGMGRTGSAAACLLKALGLPTQQALARVREAGSNPQNAEQAGFIEWFQDDGA